MTRTTPLKEPSGLPVRAFLTYGSTYVLPAVLALATTPVLTRALGPAGFGLYALCLTLFALCQPFAGEPTSGALRRLFAREDPEQGRGVLVASLFGLTLVLAALLTGLVACVTLAATLAGLSGLWARAALATGIAVGVYVVFQYLLTIHYVHESVSHTAAWQATHAVCKAGAVAAGAILLSEAAGAMASYAVVLAVVCVVMFAGGVRVSPSYSAVRWQGALRYGGPLILFTLGGLWLANLDRVVLAAAEGTDAAGRYAVAYLLAEYSVFIIVTIGLYAVYPRLVALWEAGQHGSVATLLRTMTNLFLLASTTLVAVFAVAGDRITAVLGGPDFGVTSAIPALVACGLVFSGLARLDGVVFELRMDTASWAHAVLIVSALALPITVIGVATAGLLGAAVSTLLCYLALWIIVRRRRRGVEFAGYSVPRLLTTCTISAIVILTATSVATPAGLVIAAVVQPLILGAVLGRRGGFRATSLPR